jgi:ArsR family transcriptional regulator, arsenate/arsenite/antimonite-responsive transcriptional repressor / arsenate reductase (thioredoxin)
MNVERSSDAAEEHAALMARVAKHAALADPARLRVVEHLSVGDASPSELQQRLRLASNLMAHHLKVLADAGITTRRRSQGDRRRSYVTLVPGALDAIAAHPGRGAGALLSRLERPDRVVFVCTANSARSQLATALWRRTSDVPAASAGTHPAPAIAPGARAAAERHHLRLVEETPRHLDDVVRDSDLVITVCDNAHEDLGGRDAVHWAVPDPVPVGTPAAFDDAVADLGHRITGLAHLAAAVAPSPDLA